MAILCQGIVLLSDVKESIELTHREVVEQLFVLSLINRPGCTGIGKSAKNHYTVNHKLDGKVNSFPFPYSFLQSSPKAVLAFKILFLAR